MRIFLSLVTILLFANSAQAQANIPEVPAVAFSSAPEGQVAVSMIWTIHAASAKDADLITAVALAKLNSGQGDLSSKVLSDFNAVNNIDLAIVATGSHLVFTVQAPEERIIETLQFYNRLWLENDVNPDWLKRTKRWTERRKQARFRRPEQIVDVLTDYAQFVPESVQTDETAIFEKISAAPDQIVLNSRNPNWVGVEAVLLNGMQPTKTQQPAIKNTPKPLPKGVIYVHDPDATETLIMFGEARQYPDPTDIAILDTLYKYMGYGPGSEMFRIVRQQERAAYNPTEDHQRITKDWFYSGLSATVPADDWPRLFETMSTIYNNARDGNATAQGLSDSKNHMIGVMMWDLQQNPSYLAERYLELYPDDPPDQQIRIAEIDARFDLREDQINAAAKDVMSPMEDLLIIIMGGDIEPSEALRANGYCELSIDEWIETCLDQLAEAS